MRVSLYSDRLSRLYRLDHRKIILVAFLARFIFASIYDGFVSATGRDLLLPDSTFYSMRGWYTALVLNGYTYDTLSEDLAPSGQENKEIFRSTVANEKGRFLSDKTESNFYVYLVGLVYFIFGYFPLGLRAINIVLSIASAFLLFMVAKKRLGELPARLFLIVALALPSQCLYSMTISKDFIRQFMVTLIIWGIYG